MIRWLYAFVDRPASVFDPAAAFWSTVTGTSLSPRRGEHAEFATFQPSAGDPYLKLQAVGDEGGIHLDLTVDDPASLVAAATALGATLLADHESYSVLRSPTGLVFCAVPWHSEASRPAPTPGPAGVTSRLDQVTIDVAEDGFDREIAFWATLTGWPAHQGSRPEFHLVKPPPSLPLRLMVQRLDEPRPTGAHLDFSCDDVAAVRSWHQDSGATVVGDWPLWTTMRDPAGGVYCLTAREPATGTLPAALQP